ncbi:polysaccharide deacetylase family protein [Nocardiopsis sp. EMB25]|uniref:polysaccharide deacetylase family protein n=1 Tax=Nocardiopsis sp. EMB25 TaxID=2835867 RepID=UPI0022833955|nr:polysaccharide deacetylase family protein [Nocardiopsis sp. EMB25]MCY9782820.1 polysaccharide deacetylase family protein [Nocardiopsis sp. EMB25]
MATRRPLVTVVVAMAVLAGLVLLVTQSGVLPGPDPAENTAHGSGEESPLPPATGEPDRLTVVDPSDVVDVAEETLSYDGGVSADVTYPSLPDAEPLTDFLARTLDADVAAFEAANPGAADYTAEWGLTAANDDLVGVRMTSTETDSEGSRECHSTYWYEADTGLAHGSNELIAGQDELDQLNALVREQSPDAVDGPAVLPVAALYDSVGFNPDGDLVVEFDTGQIAPVGEGPVHVVVDRDEAEPLLSDLGVRARDAATVGVEDFSLSGPPEADKDGTTEERPGLISPVDDAVDCSDPETRCVALTYDDGPGGRTPELLDTLAEYDARATFFVTGVPVLEHPRTVRRAYAEGHEIANHTLSHPDLSAMGQGAARAELETVQAQVYRETGYTMDLMRPPYGATDDGVASVTEDMGLAQILWSVDTNDWKDRNASVVSGRALGGASDGAIILMHDIHGTTIDASHEIIRELDARGYTMVTVSQLLGTTTPGAAYHDGQPEEDAEDGSEGQETGGDEEEDGPAED